LYYLTYYTIKSKRYFQNAVADPKEWFDKLPHTHKALDDAIGQGALFCNILAELDLLNK